MVKLRSCGRTSTCTRNSTTLIKIEIFMSAAKYNWGCCRPCVDVIVSFLNLKLELVEHVGMGYAWDSSTRSATTGF